MAKMGMADGKTEGVYVRRAEDVHRATSPNAAWAKAEAPPSSTQRAGREIGHGTLHLNVQHPSSFRRRAQPACRRAHAPLLAWRLLRLVTPPPAAASSSRCERARAPRSTGSPTSRRARVWRRTAYAEVSPSGGAAQGRMAVGRARNARSRRPSARSRSSCRTCWREGEGRRGRRRRPDAPAHHEPRGVARLPLLRPSMAGGEGRAQDAEGLDRPDAPPPPVARADVLAPRVLRVQGGPRHHQPRDDRARHR